MTGTESEARAWRFVHAADLHLDTPFQGLHRVDPALATRLRDASLAAWDRLVELTLDEGAALLVLAGDIYDGAERGVRAQLRFRAGLQRLADAAVTVVVVHGNHDPLDGWSAISSWPAGVHVLGSEGVTAVPVEVAGARVATVHGTSYATRDVRENLARRFQRGAEPGLHIGLLHANVGAHADHAPYAPATLADLRATGMDYWALGHVHVRQVLGRDPWVVYPGNTQGRSLHRGERGAKGAVVVEVDGEGTIQEPRFVALDEVRFEQLVVDVGPAADLGHLQDLLVAAARPVRAAAEGRLLIVRADLHGRGPAHELLRDPRVVAELVEALDDTDPSLRWDAIRVRTQPSLDRDAARGRDDLTGALVATVDAVRDDPMRLGAPFRELLTTLDGLGVELDDLDALLADAELEALAALACEVAP